ncbi:MAG: helix-turn-helix transcriptional regulator [Candidatus Paceibacterota bacterium]|jgi:ribosome-binding protein aMBF1 (putative translation factor)
MDFKDYIKKYNIDITKKDIVFDLANLVLEARLYAGISQKELAERIGTKQSNISRAEGATVEPSVSFLDKVAEAVGTRLLLPKFEFMIPKTTVNLSQSYSNVSTSLASTYYPNLVKKHV